MDALDTYLFLFGAKTYFIASLYWTRYMQHEMLANQKVSKKGEEKKNLKENKHHNRIVSWKKPAFVMTECITFMQ